MREKMTWRRIGRDADRQPADDDQVATGQSPASWLAANEAAWGIPHGLDGMLLALAWGYAAAGMVRAVRAALRPRPRAGGLPPRAGGSRARRPR